MWTTPDDLHKQLERLWIKGTLPNALITDISLFPLTLNLRTPGPSDITHRLHAVRAWAETLRAMPHISLIWHTVNNRVQGVQTLPQKAVIETRDDALALLDRTAEAHQIIALHAMTVQKAPFLLPWFSRHALTALSHAAEWDRILTLAIWIRDNPVPAVYLRQVDLPGIHTKFIERHRAVLSRVFDHALPAHAIQTARSRLDEFESRYGFCTEPLQVRFRVLDAALSPLPGCAYPDITLDAQSFAALPFSGCRVFIVENKTCFLSFPSLENALVIFGAGYCWDSLRPAFWLRDCPIYYWGDIDTHGFRILDCLRDILPHTLSFLMDEPTLLAYRPFWDTEPSPVRHALLRLTPSEEDVFMALQTHLFGQNLRLEQERIHFSQLCRTLHNMTELPP